jgi:hypothetical protein
VDGIKATFDCHSQHYKVFNALYAPSEHTRGFCIILLAFIAIRQQMKLTLKAIICDVHKMWIIFFFPFKRNKLGIFVLLLAGNLQTQRPAQKQGNYVCAFCTFI